MKDDAVRPEVRWVLGLIAPLLLVGGAILYFLPTRTEHLWAWTIRPSMTSMVMGGGYLGGFVFLLRAARATKWHTIGIGLLGADALASMLLIATVTHWDRFHHHNPVFWVWTAVYIVTPVALPLLWLLNRPRDPHSLQQGDLRVPQAVRLVIGGLGTVQLLVALSIFVRPSFWLDIWPWVITPLTARALASFFAFVAVTGFAFLFEHRWSALRIHIESASLGLALVLMAALLYHDDFTNPSFPVWAFVSVLAAVLAGLLWLQVAMRRARPSGHPVASPTQASLP
ncbi:MAG: hypothetical protein ABJA34_14095 [Pseudonocardiales bacterium]